MSIRELEFASGADVCRAVFHPPAPGAYAGFQAMAGPDFDERLAARIALVFWTYRPGRLLRRFDRPILVVALSNDRINPPRPTLARARSCAGAMVVEIPCDHMEIVHDAHHRAIDAATIGFLGRVLAGPLPGVRA